MTQKVYRLDNGTVFETEAELKGYIRGLEAARDAAKRNLDVFIESTERALEFSNACLAGGPKSEAGQADADVKSAEDPVAEKPVDAAGTAG